MKPAIRTQIDDLAEEYSRRISIDCSTLPDLTRQEFKDETDVNKTIARFAGGGATMRPTIYGEVDYNMDLQQSLAAIKTAQEACRNLPEPLRQKYYHWQMLLEGMRSGTFKQDLDAHLADEKAKQDLTKQEASPTVQDTSNKE